MPTDRTVALELERRIRRIAEEEIAKVIQQRIAPLERRIAALEETRRSP